MTNQLSLYLSLTYGYREYFTLNVNGRTDASNKFGSRSNERLLPVWSVSGMWNIQETFLKEASWLSEMRLRMSYGMQGNMLDGQTPNMLITQQPINSYYNENVSNVYQFPNPNLKWEETKQTNIGLDMSFFNGRLNIGGDFYYKKTENVFSWVNVAPTNGLTSYLMNNGSLKNVGYSVTLSATPVKINDFAWRISTSYSANKNKTQTDAVEKYELEDYLAGTAIISGESVGTFYSYEFLGLNAQNGTPVFDDYTDRRHLLEDKSLEDVVRMVMTKSGTREPVLVVIFSIHLPGEESLYPSTWPIVWVPKCVCSLCTNRSFRESVRKIMYGKSLSTVGKCPEMKNVPVFRPLSIVRTRCTITITAIGRRSKVIKPKLLPITSGICMTIPTSG